MPLQYIRLIMCRDVYHCTPAQLDLVPWRIIREDLVMINIERTVEKRRRRK